MIYLSTESNIWLIASGMLGLISILLFAFQSRFSTPPHIYLIFLIAASFCVSYFFAIADPFLHLWDEQYHALVSKNLMQHWRRPTLFESPLLNYDYKDWAANHVWLHKQPLFLWQMAASQFFFGHTELGIRFPDIIMHAVLTFLIFDLGRMLKNETVGFLSALFFTFLNFPLELVSGRWGLDHNDFAFMFYVTASFWSYFKYKQQQIFLWVLLIGLFAGCAVLTKWLPGLLVYVCWFLAQVYEQKNIKNILSNSKPIVISALVAIAVFLPWQIYCYYIFPKEFKYEMLFNGTHISKAVEGHEGNWTFHFTELNKLYGEGEIMPWALLISFLFFIYDRKQSVNNKIIIVTAIAFIYIFFSFVKTKMTGFPAIVLPLVIIVLANCMAEIISLLKNRVFYKITLGIVAIAIPFLLFDLNLVLKSHTLAYKPGENQGRHVDIRQMETIRKLKGIIKDKKTAIFNCENFNIKIMFYTDYIAYGFIPSENDCREVISKGYKIAVLKNKTLPDYIENDKSILKINY